MTNVKMKALDTLHVSAVKADNLQPNEEFEVAGFVADDLEARGLAKRIGDADGKPEPEKKAIIAAPENKSKKASK